MANSGSSIGSSCMRCWLVDQDLKCLNLINCTQRPMVLFTLWVLQCQLVGTEILRYLVDIEISVTYLISYS